MEKHEVKQEYKEQEGSPEVKHRRKEVHQEILSGQVQGSIDKSDFILANPTHIAIGVYTNTQISPLPFVSVLAKNQVALAVIAYAEKHGIPVVRDIPLARYTFKNIKRVYTLFPPKSVEPILRILQWLKEVELAHLKEIGEVVDSPEEPQETKEVQETQGAQELQESSELQRNLWMHRFLRKYFKDSLASKKSQKPKTSLEPLESQESKELQKPKEPPA
jgi:type III secretion protein U